MYAWPDNESIVSRKSLGICEVLYIRFHLQLCTGLIPTPDQDRLAPLPYRKTFSGGLRVRLDHAEREVIEKTVVPVIIWFMMTPSNGNIFLVTSPLCGELIGHRRLPLTKASDAGLWCFLWSAHEQTVETPVETLSRPLWRHCNVEKWRNS